MSMTDHASLIRTARTAIKHLLKATKVVSAVSPIGGVGKRIAVAAYLGTMMCKHSALVPISPGVVSLVASSD